MTAKFKMAIDHTPSSRLLKSIYPIFIWGICFVFMVAGCRFRPNIQGEGTSYLQGVWKQDSLSRQDRLLSYSLYEMRFSCDSVYLTIDTYNRAPNVVDSCMGNGHWKEYARGVYIVRNDSLMIEADFTYSNGRQKLSGCFGRGQFLPKFVLERYTADSLYLRSEYTDLPIQLRKTAAIDCVPQPL